MAGGFRGIVDFTGLGAGPGAAVEPKGGESPPAPSEAPPPSGSGSGPPAVAHVRGRVNTYLWPKCCLEESRCETVCDGRFRVRRRRRHLPPGSVHLGSWLEAVIPGLDCCAPDPANPCCERNLPPALQAALTVTGAGCQCLNAFVPIIRDPITGHYNGCVTGNGCNAPVCLDLFCEGNNWRLIAACDGDVILDLTTNAGNCDPWTFSLGFGPVNFGAARFNACCEAGPQDTIFVAITLPGFDLLPVLQTLYPGSFLVRKRRDRAACVKKVASECVTFPPGCCPTRCTPVTCSACDDPVPGYLWFAYCSDPPPPNLAPPWEAVNCENDTVLSPFCEPVMVFGDPTGFALTAIPGVASAVFADSGTAPPYTCVWGAKNILPQLFGIPGTFLRAGVIAVRLASGGSRLYLVLQTTNCPSTDECWNLYKAREDGCNFPMPFDLLATGANGFGGNFFDPGDELVVYGR